MAYLALRHGDPLVVAIVPTRARNSLLLNRAIPSILSQARRPSRIVVVDDNPEQDNAKVLKRALSGNAIPVEVIQNSHTQGYSGALNTAAAHLMRTEHDPERTFLAFLDDDDSWSPSHLADASAALGESADVVATAFFRIEDNSQPVIVTPPTRLDVSDFLVGNPGIQGCNLVVRLSTLLAAGGFDEALPSCTDRDLCIRLARQAGTRYAGISAPSASHYACADRNRLSSPGSWEKRAGLTAFYRKHGPHMTKAQTEAFRLRAERLFGWKPPVEISPLPSMPHMDDEKAPLGEPIHLVVGIISDKGRAASLSDLLGDLRRLQERDGTLSVLDIVILENAPDLSNPTIGDCIRSHRQRGLRLFHLSQAEATQENWHPARSERWSIAEARTALQRCLYHHAKKRPGSVVWILDDDMRLSPLVDDNGHLERRSFPLAPQIAKMREAGLDIAIGRYTGAAPLPTAYTVRVQLVDLIWNLRRLSAMPGMKPLQIDPGTHDRRYEPDYYHDLPSSPTRNLEAPFALRPYYPDESCVAGLARLNYAGPRILAGEQVFRELVLPIEDVRNFPIEPSLYRGGNTFVLDIEALADTPNPAAHLGNRFARRSDMLWAYVQQKHRGRSVGGVPTATYHDRSFLPIPDELDVAGLAQDIRGHAVFRALVEVGDASIPVAIAAATKFEDERLLAFRISAYRIRGLADEIEHWARADAPPAIDREEWIRLANRVRRQFSEASVAAVTSLLLDDRGSFEEFFTSLKGLLTAQPSPTPSPSFLARMKAERIRNAEATVAPTPANQLRVLGCGAEGVALTDGRHVFKVIDYWKARNVELARNTLESFVGRWPDAQALIPILSVERSHQALVLKMPFEETKPYSGGHGPGLIALLAECHRHRVICRNIHPKNLRVAPLGTVRLIDYGADVFLPDDQARFQSEFRHMCRRAYLSWRWAFRDDLPDLLRRALDEPDLPELDGFDVFWEAVGEAIGEIVPSDPTLTLVASHKAQRMLDFGAGKGKLAQVMAGMVERLIAFDPDPTMFRRLRQISGITAVATVDEAAAAGPFDMIVCRRVACQVDDETLKDILRTLRRAVSDDGRVVFALCHPAYAPHAHTIEAAPTAQGGLPVPPPPIWVKRITANGRFLNEFHRPEHQLRRMLHRAGFRIVSRQTRECVDLWRFERTSDLLVFELAPAKVPNVALMIKACAMEAETLAVQVRHLVSSLEAPAGFAQVVLALDTRETDFLRQHATGNLARARQVARSLVAEGWIDTVVEPPALPKEIAALNQRWLGRATSATHAGNGAQLAALWSGFEACSTPYVLHVDADVMIGRQDPAHDYLAAMTELLDADPFAVTVALSIARTQPQAPSPGNENGPWRTESRAGLVSLERLKSLLPLPNRWEDETPTLPWHRSLDIAVASGCASSWRGGDQRVFFVHPQNSRKHDRDLWFATMDQIERGIAPQAQMGQVDWTGQHSDWIPAERFEPFIFIVCGRNVAPQRFNRCLQSMLRQNRNDWGCIVVDDASEPGWAEEIAGLCRSHAQKITLVRRRERLGLLANMVEAIRHRCGNPDSVIITLDADDCLVGTRVLDTLATAYAHGADTTVGSMLRTDKQKSYPVVFDSPRENRGGNVWQHLRSFRKYLFDAIPDEQLRYNGAYIEVANDWAYMLPIIEMATCPKHIPQMLYLYERAEAYGTSHLEERERIIAELTARPSLTQLCMNDLEVAE